MQTIENAILSQTGCLYTPSAKTGSSLRERGPIPICSVSHWRRPRLLGCEVSWVADYRTLRTLTFDRRSRTDLLRLTACILGDTMLSFWILMSSAFCKHFYCAGQILSATACITFRRAAPATLAQSAPHRTSPELPSATERKQDYQERCGSFL